MQFGKAGINLRHFFQCQGLYLSAGPVAVLIQPQQFAAFLNRKVKAAGLADKLQLGDILFRIITITGCRVLMRRHHPDIRVIAHRLDREASTLRRFQNLHRHRPRVVCVVCVVIRFFLYMPFTFPLGESLCLIWEI